jgi:phosphoadenosine phosphosulfate reductase
MAWGNQPARAITDGVELARLLQLELAGSESLVHRIELLASAIKGRIAFSTGLGIEGQAILHAIAESGAPVDVFTLDTGRLFAETIALIAANEQRFGVKIRVLTPEARDVEALIARDGVLGFRESIEQRKDCCHVRKVVPLKRALAGASAWVAGLRRGQSGARADVPLAEWNGEHGLVKVNPIADWSAERLEAYLEQHAIPVNPLHTRGFPSIGCSTCTRAISPGEDIRAGRWWWESDWGKECGLHNRPRIGAAA